MVYTFILLFIVLPKVVTKKEDQLLRAGLHHYMIKKQQQLIAGVLNQFRVGLET